MFTPTPAGNEILNGEGFYISYNPSPGMGFALFDSDTGGPETALCTPGGDTQWRVLNGDFRAEYAEAVPRGLDACIAVYEANRAYRPSWSDPDA